MRRLHSLASILPLLVLVAASPAQVRLPVTIGGRVIAEAGGSFTFGWPGVYFEGRFRGTAVRVVFDAPAEHLRLLIDGKVTRVFRKPGKADVVIDRLPSGDHRIRLEKLTESQTGGARFHGFFPAAGSKPLPTRPRKRQIEFIGDSYTVGYGNSSATRTCTPEQIHDTTDTQQAFGPIVARHFDADYRINAYSGFGIVRNYGGSSSGLSLPTLYPRLKPDDPAHLEAANAGWRPQVIVINLGTNDFSTPLKAGEPWADQEALRAAYRARYAAFISDLGRRQPQARFILMASDKFFSDVEAVAASLNKVAGVKVIQFNGLDLGGCDWHPSLADDLKLASLVQQAIGPY
ncbi:SGNH/GDSL hydrolase family protein [Sphingosinicella sp. BN140058]|uniref:SGNH/GDSL hydrolase family protein n=1 Tax=Sphingosinicella sp. BN140058 TaxID=1892855 RepID=UPI001010FFAB|nr:SGNH/GDSL hydrolase family protein [Sphingosinicella sp. BN140058]QAY75727.1 lipase [Sphingosinicella sp. BN140058]